MQKSIQTSSKVPGMRVVIIYESRTGSAAILDPGYLEADPGDIVEFQNETAADAILLIAEDGILIEAHPLRGEILPRGGSRQFHVAPLASVGPHEYQVQTTLSSGRTTFAIGASTPRIIVRSSSAND